MTSLQTKAQPLLSLRMDIEVVSPLTPQSLDVDTSSVNEDPLIALV